MAFAKGAEAPSLVAIRNHWSGCWVGRGHSLPGRLLFLAFRAFSSYFEDRYREPGDSASASPPRICYLARFGCWRADLFSEFLQGNQCYFSISGALLMPSRSKSPIMPLRSSKSFRSGANLEIHFCFNPIRDLSVSLAVDLPFNPLRDFAPSFWPIVVPLCLFAVLYTYSMAKGYLDVFARLVMLLMPVFCIFAGMALGEIFPKLLKRRLLFALVMIVILLLIIPTILFDLAYGRAMQRRDVREMLRDDMRELIKDRSSTSYCCERTWRATSTLPCQRFFH